LSGTLTMHEVAPHVGLSYDRFRKVWRQLCARDGFPAPIRGRVWDAEAVARWRTERSQRRLVAPAPEPSPGPSLARVQRHRAALAELRREARS